MSKTLSSIVNFDYKKCPTVVDGSSLKDNRLTYGNNTKSYFV